VKGGNGRIGVVLGRYWDAREGVSFEVSVGSGWVRTYGSQTLSV